MGRQWRQAIEQAGGRLKQEAPRPTPALGGGWGRKLPHRRPEGRQLLRPLGIHRHAAIPLVASQALPKGLATQLQCRQFKALHLVSADPASGFLLHPGGQVTGAVAKEAIAGEGTFMHRPPIEQVLPRHRGAPPRQEGRRQKCGVKGPQFGVDHIHLQGEMAPQGGVATAHQPPTVDGACGLGRRQGWLERPTDLPQPFRGRGGIQGTAVGDQK